MRQGDLLSRSPRKNKRRMQPVRRFYFGCFSIHDSNWANSRSIKRSWQRKLRRAFALLAANHGFMELSRAFPPARLFL
jgi:hypothetical protein